MKSVLVVAPCENWMAEAAFRIRLGVLSEAMGRRGYRWEIRARPAGPLARLAFARAAGRYDAVILHRKWMDGYEARALRRAVGPGGRIIMDIDDATMFHERDLGVLARRRLDRRFAATCKILDVACTGNGYLAEIFREKSVATRVVPSVVDPARYAVKRHVATAGPRLVWIGSASTLKYLELVLPILGAAGQRLPGLSLVVICDARPHCPAGAAGGGGLPIEFVKWTLDVEPAALLEGDIGIAPTPENRWTLGKCGYKIVQYMAAGLPVIASPVGVNRELLEGVGAGGGGGGAAAGVLAAEWSDWLPAVERLAGDVGLRESMGGAGRRRIESELNVEKVADAWAEVLG